MHQALIIEQKANGVMLLDIKNYSKEDGLEIKYLKIFHYWSMTQSLVRL